MTSAELVGTDPIAIPDSDPAETSVAMTTASLDMDVPFEEANRSPRTRSNEAVITRGPDLGSVWPEVERRLGAYLRRLGTTPHDVEDLVQECAVRLLAADLAWTDADSLLQWCVVVARRARVDQHRRQQRVAEPPEDTLPSWVDVEREVEVRLRLAAVRRAWHRLSPSDQVLLSTAAAGGVETPADRQDAVRVNVARHRARKRLTALMGAPSALVALVFRGLRRGVPGGAVMTSAAMTALLSLSLQQLDLATPEPSPQVVPSTDWGHAVLPGAPRQLLAVPTPISAPIGAVKAGPPGTRSGSGGLDIRPRRDTGLSAHGRQRTQHDALVSVCIGDLPSPANDVCLTTGPQPFSSVEVFVRSG